ncbi:MAG: sodium-dependent transporter [Oscillospiraceae bacterium]
MSRNKFAGKGPEEPGRNGRDKWSSRFGFIMSAAGSAVGLGNIWKFPYMAGTNGGAVFLAAYIFFALLLGVPILLTELAVGRAGGKNAVDSCRAIDKRWGFAGYFGIAGSFIVLSYYSVVGGWVMKYLVSCANDNIPVSGFFQSYSALTAEPLAWQFIFIFINAAIVLIGVSKGIEKVSSVLLPLLLVFLLGLMFYSLSLDGAAEGVKFFLKPDLSSVGSLSDILTICVKALGQVFFSLSLGMGTLITYGSYLDKNDNLPKSTFTIVGIDTLIAVISGLTVMPAVFALGMEPDAGAGLIFSTLPAVFAQLPAGSFMGTVFFLLVLFAAITSAISLLEVIAAFLSETFNMSRKLAAVLPSALIFLLSVPASMSYGRLRDFTVLGMNIFDFLVFLSDQIIMPLGGLFLCILAGHIWGRKGMDREITSGGRYPFVLSGVFSAVIKYAAPGLIAVITVSSFLM